MTFDDDKRPDVVVQRQFRLRKQEDDQLVALHARLKHRTLIETVRWLITVAGPTALALSRLSEQRGDDTLIQTVTYLKALDSK